MALKTVEWTEKYVKVNKLTDIDVEFISLVPKGANREPFRIVKADTGDTKMANDSMRPDQRLQSLYYKTQTQIDKIKSANDGSAPPIKPGTKLQKLNESIREDSERLLKEIEANMAELESVDTGSTLQPVTATPPNPETKRAPASKGVVGRFSTAFGEVPSLVQKGEVIDSKPVPTPQRKDVSYGDCFGGGLECSILQKDEGGVPEKAYRLKGDIGDQLEKKGCAGLWNGVFDHSTIYVVEAPLEKADDPVELPKSKFSFGD